MLFVEQKLKFVAKLKAGNLASRQNIPNFDIF